jgi:putative transposase
MIAGYYIGEEHPSAMSAGLALSHAILSKAATLAEYDIAVAWPANGYMVLIHADNAREFRGAMLQKACDKHGMTLKLRPVKTPHYGGHIERLCGTLNEEIHTLPGTTFSNPNARSGYNSSAEAAMTLSDLKHWFVKYVVEDYHNREHSETKLTPLQKWRHGMTRIGELRQPEKPDNLRIDLMPFTDRSVQAYGIQIDKICYYDEVLRPLINRIDPETGKKVRLLLHYDPRDKSRLYAWMPSIGAYHVIPFRDTRHPPVSEQDLREARALSKSRGEEPTEANIFKTRRELDAIAERSVERKKSARKTVNRNKLAKDLAAKAPIGPIGPVALLLSPPADPQPAPATPTEVLTYDDIGFFPTED